MALNKPIKMRTIIVSVFIPLFLFITFYDLVSAPPRKRSYKRERTRNEAIETIRNSEAVSEIAGIDPAISDTLLPESTEVSCEISEMGEDPKELQMEDDISVDIETFKLLWISFVAEDEEDLYTAGGLSKKEIMEVIMEWLGTPYRFGGNTERAIDCSAFTRMIFRQCNIELPRTAREQIQVGQAISREELEFGDLVFFYTYTRRYASHVGIYLGDDLFAHASSRSGVTVSTLNRSFYDRRFIEGRRLTVKDVINLSNTENQEEPFEN